MEKSESIKEIAMALSKFQGEIFNPKNTATNPSFNSKYAPLSEVINTIRQGLAKNGLSIVQAPYTDGDNVIVETFLLHTSGEWISSPPLCLKMDRVTAQGAGSAITYARRYALSALLNISSEEDVDGNRVENLPLQNEAIEENNSIVQPPISEVEDLITDKQIKYMHVLAKEKGIDSISLRNYSKSLFGKESSKELTRKEASELIESLQFIGVVAPLGDL